MDVRGFEGTKAELKWNLVDLENLKQVVPLVQHKRVAIQAGSCLGVFPKYLSSVFETVYTFEPNPDSFVKMTKNAPEKNIIRFQAALGVKHGPVNPVTTTPPGKKSFHEGMTRVQEGQGVVPTLRIDDLGLLYCDLIYLDIEGYELYALQGAIQTLSQCKPVVVVEINQGLEHLGLRGDDVRTFLRMWGYEFQMKIRSDEVYLCKR